MALFHRLIHWFRTRRPQPDVPPPPEGTASLDFSDPANSGYVAAL